MIRKRLVSHPIPEFTRQRSKAFVKRIAYGFPPNKAAAALIVARLLSALYNIIHDCDETFNYLEPLHYILHGYGFQTWEYSSQYALRSYLYLLLHAAVGAPISTMLGAGKGKLVVFYFIKFALSCTSALTEWWLYRAVYSRCCPAVANNFLVLLCCTTGMFVSSTGLLPSSFSMYTLTAGAAAVLAGRPYPVIVAAVVGVVWGWCVAGVAFLPYAFYVLAAASFPKALLVGLLSLMGTMGPLVLVDKHFYGKWTASLWNFIQYNVIGGGESALYGVEGPSFYLRNGFNNFTLALPLALLLPPLAILSGLRLRLGRPGVKGQGGDERQSTLRMLVCLSPLYIWFAAITALPHKEERFLFVVYPLICLASAASLATLADCSSYVLASILPARTARQISTLGRRAVLSLVAMLALSRTLALRLNYGAPLLIYQHLPEVSANSAAAAQQQQQHVCVGAEWHRFPSSFFLPGPSYRLQFIKSGFQGLLPRHFDPSQGGTAAAPAQLNDQNRQEPANFWDDLSGCDYLVTLQKGVHGTGATIDDLGGLEWETMASLPFVDQAQSPPLSRAFFVPFWSTEQNVQVQYVLLKQKR